jgi:dTDP-4-dehydrorhamnose reductase
MAQSTEQNSERSRAEKRVLITGSMGLLGRFMTARLDVAGWLVFSFPHTNLDISNPIEVRDKFNESQPQLVINCAATADVDRCEREPAWAYAVNEEGPRLLAQECNKYGADLVHISTDYVFDGLKGGLYTQEDVTNPLSVYAQTKLAGEIAVRDEARRFYIIRTSWIFGPGGKNFGSRVVQLAREGAHIRAVTDQTSIPTYAPDLAARIEELINLGAHGLYHVTNTGPTNWFDFARQALDLAELGDTPIEPVTREALQQMAARPHNTPMRCLVSDNLGLQPLRHWRQGLAEFVREYEMKTPR